MRKSNYYKSIFRDMKNTKGKIFSIFIMIMLASMIVVALFLTGPTMRNTLNNTLKNANHPDMIISSTYGLKDEDKVIIEKDKGIENVSYQKGTDLYYKDLLLSIDSKDETFPKYNIKKGRDLKNNNEIIIDEVLKDEFKIGDTIEFDESLNKNIDDKLKNKKFKIVGFANSTENLMNDIRDYSIEGKKMVDGFAIISYDNFKTDDIKKANILYKDTKNLHKFDETYISYVDKKKKDLEDDFKYRPSEVLKKLKDESNKKLDENEKELDDAKKKLGDEQEKLYNANEKLLNGINKYYANEKEFQNKITESEEKLKLSKVKIDNGYIKLDKAKKQYESGLNEYNTKFSNAEKRLKDLELEINKAYKIINDSSKEIEEGKNKIESSFKSQKDKLVELNNNKSKLELEISKINESKKSIEENIKIIEKKIENLDDSEENKEEIDKLSKSREDLSNKFNELDSKNKELIEKKEEIDLSFKEFKNKYDLAYNEAMAPILEKEDVLNKKKNNLGKKNTILQESIRKINIEKDSARNKLNESKSMIASNEASLNEALNLYNLSYERFKNEKENGRFKLDKAYEELLENQRKLEETNKKFFEEKDKSLKKINDGYDEIEDARENLVRLPDPKYSIGNILSNKAIDTYYKNSKNMDELSKVFPTFFYFIALLVSLTTIKRYIEEQRIQNGTLKSLGYANKDIANKFYIYALSPTILGSIIGVILGKYLISKIIFKAYSSGFDIFEMDFPNSFLLVVTTIILSIILITLTVFFTSNSEVKEQTADLLRPKPPRGGSRIFLEKIDFLWKRLSFMTKITFRNLFRYKSRMLMTIFGIGGCTALLFFGFAMTDSIKDTSNIQRQEISKYDYINIFDNRADVKDKNEYEDIINGEMTKRIYYKSVEIDLKDDIKANLIVFENQDRLNEFIDIRDKSKNPIKLCEDSLVVTTNLYNKLNEKDELKFLDKKVKIKDVAENYIDDYIYMSKEAYENNFNDKLEFNADIINTENKGLKDKILKNKASLSLIEPNKSYETIDSLMANLNLVIGIITLVSAILAIVVLYNLTNINVSERKKELATTKVLGFFPRETTAYIYRETYILTILGIMLGYILGYIMLKYVLLVVAPDGIYLSAKTHPLSYIISAIVTLFISFIIMIIVHLRLKKINMAEAMKAGE
ncbi:FtsX-like permease family protein [Anaerococcus porci]|uniref:FtsX-like permease family protein n=1 Tax=Anaerococcus porci TaxID=2652269 RepID=UPI002A75CC06|nr:FtsX-like permease family protein [Anaerococcus porci]MDY3007363.1 FtsX-like permease family protein [Anaerococcus porci]